MSKTQKIITTALWGAVVVAMVGIVATRATRPQPQRRPAIEVGGDPAVRDKFTPLFDAPDFQLTDQTGKLLTRADLLGNIWVADFIFTRCAGPCPIMTGKMSGLQKAVDRPDVKLVSFTVDPEHDTPEVLKEYAKRFGADDARWHFLTGPKGAIFDVAAGLRIAAKPASGEDPILHSERFILIDRAGKVVAIYHSNDDTDLHQLIDDMKELAEKTANK